MVTTYLFYVLLFTLATFLFFILPIKFRKSFLIILGYGIYVWFSGAYAFLLFGLTLLCYFWGLYIESHRLKGKSILIIYLVFLSPLIMLKYFHFNKVTNAILNFEDFFLPLGISFFSFQMLSYVLDINKGFIKSEKNIQNVLLHHAFFPIFFLGPIERAKNLFKQFNFDQSFNPKVFRDSLFLILWGIFKKIVISQNLFFVMDNIKKEIHLPNFWETLLLMSCSVFYIFIDFSAYVDISRGAAKAFGIQITKNIDDQVYLSTSRTELWRKWHISLTSWFRDYVFFPLSKRSSKLVYLYALIIIIYLLSGIWHDFTPNFFLWGGLNGFLIVLEQATKSRREILWVRLRIAQYPKVILFLGWLLFFITCMILNTLFLAPNLHQSYLIIKGLWNFSEGTLYLGRRTLVVIPLNLLILLGINYIKGKREVYELLPPSVSLRFAVYIFLLLITYYFQAPQTSGFLYGRF